MLHDHLCERNQVFTGTDRCRFPECFAQAGHCHCGARAFPLCVGCRDGRHLQHRPHVASLNQPCACDLCEEAA